MFIHYKDKINNVYASIQEIIKIEDDGDLNKYLGMLLELHPDS